MKELQRTGVLLCEANGHSDTTEIPRLLWNPEIYWPVRWSPPSPIACVIFCKMPVIFHGEGLCSPLCNCKVEGQDMVDTISYSKSSSDMGVTFLKIAKKGERWHNGALFCPLELTDPGHRKYLSSASGNNVNPNLGNVSRIFWPPKLKRNEVVPGSVKRWLPVYEFNASRPKDLEFFRWRTTEGNLTTWCIADKLYMIHDSSSNSMRTAYIHTIYIYIFYIDYYNVFNVHVTVHG